MMERLRERGECWRPEGGVAGGRAAAGIKARKTKMTSSPHHCRQCAKFHESSVNLDVFFPAGFDRNFHLLPLEIAWFNISITAIAKSPAA